MLREKEDQLKNESSKALIIHYLAQGIVLSLINHYLDISFAVPLSAVAAFGATLSSTSAACYEKLDTKRVIGLAFLNAVASVGLGGIASQVAVPALYEVLASTGVDLARQQLTTIIICALPPALVAGLVMRFTSEALVPREAVYERISRE